MTIARLVNIVPSTRTEDQNAKTSVLVGSFVVEIQNVPHVIMSENVNAKKDSMLMEKFARKLNVKLIMIVAMTNDVTTICVNLSA